jgi:cobalt/nickel transport system permease protein
MALAAPLGLLYNSGAYGEDNPTTDPKRFLQRNHLSSIPAGLDHYTGFWHHALFNGYDFHHDKHPAVGYVVSAFFGALVISAALLAVFALVRAWQSRHAAHDPDPARP